MKLVQYKLEGDQVFISDTHLQGMVMGSAKVLAGVVLELEGMVVKDLLLEKNSVVRLRGTVNGDVINNGGHLDIEGTVHGTVFRNDGTTIIDPNALINQLA
jgi:hypothetical protein